MKIKIGLTYVCILFLSPIAHADKIYLQRNPQGNAGQVLEEYPDSIVIKFPKSEIRRIEAQEKPALNQTSAQKVIWIDDGNTITLRLPKQSVQISGTGTMAPAAGAIIPVSSLQEFSFAKASEESRRSLGEGGLPSLPQGGSSIQGKVLLKGNPLANCKIRILEIGQEQKSFESITDEQGIYTFTNVPYGEYILYWQPEGSEQWIRRLSENPDITLVPGRPVSVRNIETNVKTVN